MDISLATVADRVDEHVETYRETAPFYPVEKESIESLPAAFRAGEYGPRDVDWVVRWYFRRRVDAIDHEERREIEERVEDADGAVMREAMWDAVDALDGADDDGADSARADSESGDDLDIGDDPDIDDESDHHAALDALTRIPGVDVAVGSAFLWFLDPDRFFAVGDREWRVVAALTDLDEAYPDPMTLAAYDRYLEAVRTLADRLEVDHWHLYQVIQRLHAEASDETTDEG